MARPASSSSFPCFGSLAAAAFGAAFLVAMPGLAVACGYVELDVASETTFDPHVLGEPSLDGQFYDPYREGFRSVGDDPRKELLADWASHLGAVSGEDWSKVLFKADLGTIDGLIFYLQGKREKPPAGFEQSFFASAPPQVREKLVAALFLVGFARRVEPFAEGKPAEWWGERELEAHRARVRAAGDPAVLQRNGEKALARASDPFLRQRYAFQLLRLRFYREDWPGVVAFHTKNAAMLEGPSIGLRWRARYYRAGANWRRRNYAAANLELARIHAGYPPLAGEALRDFHPMEEADWQETLKLAGNRRERTELWQMVGLTKDAIAAMDAIVALDPASDLLGLLAVREVNRVEHRVPASDSRQFEPLERLAIKLAAGKQTDRRWLYDLIAGHIAALRGDLPAARERLARATSPATGSPPPMALDQARASLAMALARTWRPDKAPIGDELARTLEQVKGSAGQLTTARRRVRDALGATCVTAGLKVEAELLTPTSPSRWGPPPASKPPWNEAGFIQALIARVTDAKTPFERFLVQDSGYTRSRLETELAQLHLVKGDFATAERVLSSGSATYGALGTDPFVMHIIDCHDCDHEKYASAPWTLAKFVARLLELERKAGGAGEEAAKAAFQLGSGLYNMTYAGNARVVLAGSHNATSDTRMAERWFKRAYELSGDRELKARSATMAAKCELARDEGKVSKTWYPLVRSLSDAAYYKEVLAECGWFRGWSEQQPK